MSDAVRLTPIAGQHAEATLRWVSDPGLAADIGLTREASAEYTRAWIARSRNRDSVAAFAILVGDEHVGNVVFDRIDRRLRSARFSIYIGEQNALGRGIGRKATCAALDVAFGDLGLDTVWLNVHSRNVAAIRLYESVGFSHEESLEGDFPLGDEKVDRLRMVILAEDFARE